MGGFKKYFFLPTSINIYIYFPLITHSKLVLFLQCQITTKAILSHDTFHTEQVETVPFPPKQTECWIWVGVSAGSKLVQPVRFSMGLRATVESRHLVTVYCNFPALLGTTVELETNMTTLTPTSVAPGFGKSNIVVILLWISQKDGCHS